jgi:hypothetical protein
MTTETNTPQPPSLDELVDAAARQRAGTWAAIFAAYPGLTHEELAEKFHERAELLHAQALELQLHEGQRQRLICRELVEKRANAYWSIADDSERLSLQIELGADYAVTVTVCEVDGARTTLWHGAGEQSFADQSRRSFRAWLDRLADDLTELKPGGEQ